MKNLLVLIKRAFLFIVSLFLHFLAIGLILYLVWPIAKWYLDQIPARGIDLFNSVSYVTYLLKHFALRVNGWNYTWFSGVPLARDYPLLYFYLMLPFAKYFGVVRGVQIFALVGNFAFITFSYLLFSALAKNRVLAVILALAVAYSVNFYRALVWAGGIPFFVTQAMFPLVLLLIVKFIQSQNKRFLVLAACVSGLGVLGHPQSFVNFIFPSVFLLLALSSFRRLPFLSREKIKNLALYGVITFLVGLPGLYHLIFGNFIIRLASLFNINLLGITPPEPAETNAQITEWVRKQFYFSFSDTNSALFHLLAISAALFVLGLIIRKTRKEAIINTVVMGLVAAWAIFYIYLLSIGIDIYHGGREAFYKLFWSVPIVIGALASQCWGVFSTSFSERIKGVRTKIITSSVLEIFTGVVLAFLAVSLFSSYSQGIIKRIVDVSMFSSPFPEAVSARLTPEGQAKVAGEAKPSFLKDAPGDYRLYCNDQTVNLWWSSQFTTPLARGYVDPPLGGLKERWGLFWMDAAFGPGTEGGTSLGDDWNTPEEVVEKNIGFLLDWYAIGYLEGNHGAVTSRGPLPPLLTSEKFVEETEEREVKGGLQRYPNDPARGEWEEERWQKMNFFKIKDGVSSPIHQATNAPTVLVVGGGDSFDIVTRFFGMMGLNSQEVIVAAGPQFIDKISFTQMLDFDALILYKYDYKNYSKSWGKIERYLEKGGKIFLDTGTEVKESSSTELPAEFPKELPGFFPIKQTKRGDLGKTWAKEIGDMELFEGIETSKFSSFSFDDKPWNISHSPGKKADVREGAKVLLYSHGYPVLAEQEVGEGRIIWSGINLPYHVLYNYNFEEGKLLVNLFSRLFDFGQARKPDWSLDWVSPQKRIIRSSGAKGVLFKEQAFSGWKASVKGEKGNSQLAIYKVGPSSPGFMYVRVPEKIRTGEFEVTFSFQGALNDWIISLIGLISAVFAGDYVLSGSKFTGFFLSPIWSRLRKKTGSWWEKDEY